MKKLEDKNKGGIKERVEVKSESFEAHKEGFKSMFNNFKLFVDTHKAKQLVDEIQNASFEAASCDRSEGEQVTEDAEFEVIEPWKDLLGFGDGKTPSGNEVPFETEEVKKAREVEEMKGLEQYANEQITNHYFIPAHPLHVSFDFNNGESGTVWQEIEKKELEKMNSFKKEIKCMDPHEYAKLILGNWPK